MAFDLEKLNIVIEGSADKASDAIDRLISKLHELQGTVGSLASVSSQVKSAFSDIAKAAKTAAEESEKTSASMDGVVNVAARTTDAASQATLALSGTSQALLGAGESANTAALGFANFGEIVEQIQAQFYGTARALPGMQSDFYEASFTVRDLGDSFGEATDNAKGFNSTVRMLDALGKIVSNLGFPDHSQLDGLLNGFKSFVGGIKSSIGGLWAAFKRIAMYRMIRASIKLITQAVKEGLEILVEWDRTYNNNTSNAAKTTDELAAKWREVKKSLGAAAMPLIQIMQPALEWLMNAVIWLANALNQILRSAQGYSTYMKATNQYTKSTVGAAKELKRVLFGFDELNILPSDSGSGASSSINPLDYVETDITHWLPKGLGRGIKDITDGIKKDFKDAWAESKKGWEQLKGHLQNAWTAIKPGIEDAAEGIADDFTKAWNETLEGWKEVKKNWETFKTWIDEHLIQPFKEKFEALKLWIYEKMPWLAKLLGIDSSDFKPKVTMSVDASVSAAAQGVLSIKDGATPKVKFTTDAVINTATNTMLTASKLAGSTLKVKFTTDTTLSPDTKKLLTLVENAGSGSAIGGLGQLSITKKAAGGDVDMGTLFYAGERGAEVVATSPSGTGVMNVKQMQEAVSNGNAQTVNAVYAMANMIVQAINAKDVNSYLDGRLVTDTVARGLNNRTRATGQPVIAR